MANEFKVKKGLIVTGSGGTIFDIQGSQGQLFSVTDDLTGVLFSVNDISGIPIFEVSSDDELNMGTYGAEAIKIIGSTTTISNLVVTGTTLVTNLNADYLDGQHGSFYYPASNPNGYSSSAGSVDFNNLTNKTSGTGTYQTSGDFRAPIFYDSNDTNYYADFNATSDSAIRVRGGALHGPNPSWGKYLLVGGDGRQNYTNNADVASVCTTDGNLHIDAGSGKSLYLNFYDGNEIYLGNGSSGIASSILNDGSHRPQIIYDYNNTAFYLDPNATSNLYDLQLTGAKDTYLLINPGNGYEAMVRYLGGSGSSWYVGKRTANNLVGTESFHFYSEAAGATVGGVDTGGNIHASTSMRAPVFYDSNNTSFFLDPNGTSNVNNMIVNGSLGVGVSPTEKLEVNGNIKTTKTYVGPTGIVTIFTNANNANSYEQFETGLAITRAAANGPYNPLFQSSYIQEGLTNMEWNADGWGTLSNVESRTYIDSLYNVIGGNFGNNIVGLELVLRSKITRNYYKIKFTSWTQGGNGGGFVYTRELISIADYYVKAKGFILNNGAIGYLKSDGTVDVNDVVTTTYDGSVSKLNFKNNPLANITIDSSNQMNFGTDIFIKNTLRIGNGSNNDYESTGFGYGVFASNPTGNANTTIGAYSLYFNTTGGYNTALGYQSGMYTASGNSNSTGNNSVFLGTQTRPQLNGQTNQIVIGYTVNGRGSNTVTIGNGNVTNNYFNGDVNATSSFKAPIFYDSDNTSYYVNPSSHSRLNTLDVMSYVSAPIFYDINNTGYYVDPTSTSNLVGLTVANTISGNISGNAASATNASQLGGIAADRFVFGDGANGRSKSNGNANTSDSSNSSGFYFGNSTTGMPTTDWWNWLTVAGNSWSGSDGYRYQLAASFWGDDLRFRRQQTGGWQSWVSLLHSGNYSAYSSFSGPVSGTLFSDSDNTAYYFDGNNTGDSIRVAGDIVAYYSDERLKNKKGNIENALEKVLSLNGFYYEPNEIAQDLGYKKKLEVGVSAQEVEAVLPEIIKDAPIGGGYKTLDYSKLTPLLIEAIKEQQKQIEELKKLIPIK